MKLEGNNHEKLCNDGNTFTTKYGVMEGHSFAVPAADSAKPLSAHFSVFIPLKGGNNVLKKFQIAEDSRVS